MMAREFRVLRRNAVATFTRAVMQPLLFVFVFAYVFPKIGGGFMLGGTAAAGAGAAAAGGVNFATILVPGLMASMLLMQGIMAVTFPLVMEFSWQRTIEDRALAPVPIRVLAIQKISAGAVQSFLGALIVFPIVLLVHASGQAPHVDVTNWALFALILVFASLLTASLGLLLGTVMDPRKMQMLFAVILLPATMLGCVYYPWAALQPHPLAADPGADQPDGVYVRGAEGGAHPGAPAHGRCGPCCSRSSAARWSSATWAPAPSPSGSSISAIRAEGLRGPLRPAVTRFCPRRGIPDNRGVLLGLAADQLGTRGAGRAKRRTTSHPVSPKQGGRVWPDVSVAMCVRTRMGAGCLLARRTPGGGDAVVVVTPLSASLAGFSRAGGSVLRTRRENSRARSADTAAGSTGGGDEAQGGHISAEARINERIRAPEVRLVGPKGEQIGIVSVNDALKLAQEADLDLVEVAPTARPPVCKLMDYGKFKYESAVKARESRKNQTQTIVKEIKLRPKIDPHDYGTKKGHVERFLKAGDKVKVTIMFRGREQSRPELGFRLLQRLASDVEELGFVESQPKQDGRNMIMVIGPYRKKSETKAHTAGQAQNRSVPSPRAAAAAAAPRTGGE